MNADRPIRGKSQDRLGFAPIAEHLATVLTKTPGSEGLVIGVEGAWGSGKSTLLNLTKEVLRGSPERPEIVDFAPWLVGDREALLKGLFGELAATAIRIDPVEASLPEQANSPWKVLRRLYTNDAHWKLKQKERFRKRLGGQLNSFGSIAGALGKGAQALGVPGGEAAGGLIASGTGLIGGDTSLAKRKRALVPALAQLSRRIVVFIDDLDRLEPKEAAEVLRLVRAVADFPNVVYVLSYDPSVLAQTLKHAVQVDDGAAFLEKIVQVSFRVPRPQAYDLRNWFFDGIMELFANAIDIGDRLRFTQAIDVQGGRYLRTPRDVVRALNALRLNALPVIGQIDLADMIWLQLTRLGNNQLFHWVEEYMTTVAAISAGANISAASGAEMAERLGRITRHSGGDQQRTELTSILPGIKDSGYTAASLYQQVHSRNIIDPFVYGRRLGSPQHFRYYFAFSHPAGALTDDLVKGFILAAEDDRQLAIEQFAIFAKQTRPHGGTAASMLIDRLVTAHSDISKAAMPGIIMAIATHIDELGQFDRDDGSRTWSTATLLLNLFFRSGTPIERMTWQQEMFQHGASLGWLSDLMLKEWQAHKASQSESSWLLDADEFTKASGMMLERYRAATSETIIGATRPVVVLEFWSRCGPVREVRDWVSKQSGDPEQLVHLFLQLRSRKVTNGHVTRHLRRDVLSRFIDFDVLLDRLKDITNSAELSPVLQAQAIELVEGAMGSEQVGTVERTN